MISHTKIIFSLKEIEIIKQLIEGKSLSDMAKEMDCSENTLDFYLVNAIKKLNALRGKD